MNRLLYVVLAALVCVLACLCACTAPAAIAEPTQTPVPTATPDAAVRLSTTMVGFIAPQGEDIALCTALHGFLRTAENLGYPAKVYRAAMGADAAHAVEAAHQEGCAGLLIWNPAGQNDPAIEQANSLRIPVVVPYFSASGAGVTANVATDIGGYSEEVARGIAERMVERECKAGKILVYGTNPQEACAAFRTAIDQYYPQYNVGYFVRTAFSQQGAIDELAEHILWNRDIKGLFCTDEDGALIAVRAREQAQREFKANGAPEKAGVATSDDAASEMPSPAPEGSPRPSAMPQPTASVMPGATPVPEGLIKSITISVAGMGINDDNIALMKENDIYAFVAEPYYEASAQSLMVLDRILNGESVPQVTKVNMPIVRQDTLDKYELIYRQVQEWFDLVEQEPVVGE